MPPNNSSKNLKVDSDSSNTETESESNSYISSSSDEQSNQSDNLQLDGKLLKQLKLLHNLWKFLIYHYL